MRRRDALAILGAAAALRAMPGRADARVPRLAYFWFGAAGSETSTSSGLQAGLRELGYREGRNIVVDYHYADGQAAKLKAQIAAALAAKPDVILAPGAIVTKLVQAQTSEVPVVSTTFDPIGSGFAASLARPGGNITGLAIAAGPELAEKWIELIEQFAPDAAIVAVLANDQNPATRAQIESMNAMSRHSAGRFAVRVFSYHEAADLPAALAAIAGADAQALIPDIDPLTVSKRGIIVAFAAEHRLPAVYGLRDFVDAGGLASYGASIFDIWRRAASYVDRILKGAKPADLPIEQPTKFELVIDLKTAKALGLAVPQSILARADEVIE